MYCSTTHLGFGKRHPDCDEDKCGTTSNVLVQPSKFDLRVMQSKIKNAGKGLFAAEFIPMGSHIGYFGGVRECASCVKYVIKGSADTVSIDFVEGDYEYGERDDVLWYLTRCYNSMLDGKMWFINSSHRRNILKELRVPNVDFCGGGLTRDGHPVVEVCAIVDIAPGVELLANYMKKLPH